MSRLAKPGPVLSRRDVLRVLGALGAGSAFGTAFMGCSCSSSESSPGNTGARGDAGDGGDAGTSGAEGGAADGSAGPGALGALRALLRTSPDHLQARAEDAVGTKDPTKIAEFVRDHITVLPGLGREDDPDVATYSRWGAAATLRAGAGSLRDRVDLMVMLLRAAGISSTVKAMTTPAGLTAEDLYRPRVNDFSIDQTELTRILNAAGSGGVPQSPEASPPDGSAEFEAAVAAVLPLATASVDALPTSDLLVPTKIPVVVVGSAGGGTATVLVAVAHQATTTVDPSTLTFATDANVAQMTITVSALMNPPTGGGPPSYVDLVQGSFPLDQVIGHQAQIVFVPPQGTKSLLTTPLSSAHVRVPMIRIQPRPGADLDPYANALLPPGATSGAPAILDAASPPSVNPPYVAVGPAFSIEGELLPDPSAANAPIVVLDDTEHAAAVAKVAKITGTVNATAFPTVELDLSITDASGASVDGLGAGDLTVVDGTTTVPVTVVANRSLPHKPRVLISYDASGSITNFWTSAAARSAFEKNLATILTNVAAQHPFEAQVVGLAGDVPESGWAPPTVSSLSTAMANASSLSDVWATFAGAAVDSGPVVIIMVSDFDDPDTTYIDEAKKRLARSGIPVVALTVGTVNESIAQQIVTVSNGTELVAGSPSLTDVVGTIVSNAVSEKANVSYRVRYDAPVSGGSPRSVTVALATKASISASLSYDVPAESARIVPPSVASVYVTIAFGAVTERRRLGGAVVSDHGNALQEIDDPNVVEDARSVLDGLTTIAIEPASPTLAAVLDDVVLAHQSLKPWHDVWSSGDPDAFARAAVRSYRYPGLFAALLPVAPADPTAPIVVPRGLRVAVLTERKSGGKFLRQIDTPPRLNAMRALRAGATDLEAVVRASLRLSANEALIFDDTAYGTLAKRALVTVQGAGLPSDVLAMYASSPADSQHFTNLSNEYYDLVRLVPSDGGTIAFWVIDPASGSVAAVDASGRGGGDSSGDITLYDALNIAIFVAGLGCTLGLVPWPFFCVGLTVLSVVTTVAALFTQPLTPGTPFGFFSTVFGATMSFKKVPPFPKGGVGVALVVIILFLIAAETFDQ